VTKRLIQESAPVAERAADGSYPIVLIVEGTGTTGVYGASLMIDEQARLFENVASFANHPLNPEHPEQRDIHTISGRITHVQAGEADGRRALLGKYTPNSKYAAWVEENKDLLEFSIFSLAYGSQNDAQGRLIVEGFSPEDPYRSVDLVLAGGAGGRFRRAQESLRILESSLGQPEGAQPGAAPAPGTTNQEDHMDPKDIEAIAAAVAEAFKPVLTLLGEQKIALEALKAGAPAAAPKETKDVIESAVDALTAIEKAEIKSATAKESLIASVKRGEDVTESLAYIIKVQAESAAGSTGDATYIQEGAAPSGVKHDFSIARLAVN
jgi:hypothetical protein